MNATETNQKKERRETVALRWPLVTILVVSVVIYLCTLLYQVSPLYQFASFMNDTLYLTIICFLQGGIALLAVYLLIEAQIINSIYGSDSQGAADVDTAMGAVPAAESELPAVELAADGETNTDAAEVPAEQTPADSERAKKALETAVAETGENALPVSEPGDETKDDAQPDAKKPKKLFGIFGKKKKGTGVDTAVPAESDDGYYSAEKILQGINGQGKDTDTVSASTVAAEPVAEPAPVAAPAPAPVPAPAQAPAPAAAAQPAPAQAAPAPVDTGMDPIAAIIQKTMVKGKVPQSLWRINDEAEGAECLLQSRGKAPWYVYRLVNGNPVDLKTFTDGREAGTEFVTRVQKRIAAMNAAAKK